MDNKTLSERLTAVATGQGGVSATYRRLTVAGWVSAELTVRRYLSGARPPSTEFVTTFCETFEVNPVWLLFGEGAKGWARGDAQGQALQDALALVVRAVAGVIEGDELGTMRPQPLVPSQGMRFQQES